MMKNRVNASLTIHPDVLAALGRLASEDGYSRSQMIERLAAMEAQRRGILPTLPNPAPRKTVAGVLTQLEVA